MLRTCLRDNRSIGEYTETLPKALACIVSAELQYGAKVEETANNTITYSTLIMGCKDITIMSGTEDEMEIFRKVNTAYRGDKTPGIVNFLLTEMSQEYDPSFIYDIDDVFALYELAYMGEDISMLAPEIAKRTRIRAIDNLTSKTSDELLKIHDEMKDITNKFGLSPEDGANALIRAAVLR